MAGENGAGCQRVASVNFGGSIQRRAQVWKAVMEQLLTYEAWEGGEDVAGCQRVASVNLDSNARISSGGA